MFLVSPAPPLNVPRSGTCETAREAAQELVECWNAYRRYYGIED